MTFEFDDIFALRDHVATFLTEEDARYMAHDIAICIATRNEDRRLDFDIYNPAGHDIAELAEMVREQETDADGNWLHVA